MLCSCGFFLKSNVLALQNARSYLRYCTSVEAVTNITWMCKQVAVYSVFQSNPSENVASPQPVGDHQNHFDRVTFIRDLSQSLVDQQEEDTEG